MVDISIILSNNYGLLVVSTHLKNYESQWEGLSHIIPYIVEK